MAGSFFTGDLLLDTNIVAALIEGEPAVVAFVGQAEGVFLPSIVLGELYYGAFYSGRRELNVQRVDALAAGRTVLGCDRATARQYGQIKGRLRAKGRPIPENDIWIAAIAQQYGLTLVSRDAHFGEVEGLRVVSISP